MGFSSLRCERGSVCEMCAINRSEVTPPRNQYILSVRNTHKNAAKRTVYSTIFIFIKVYHTHPHTYVNILCWLSRVFDGYTNGGEWGGRTSGCDASAMIARRTPPKHTQIGCVEHSATHRTL